MQNLTCEARVAARADFLDEIDPPPPNSPRAVWSRCPQTPTSTPCYGKCDIRLLGARRCRSITEPTIWPSKPPSCRSPGASSQAARAASRKIYSPCYPHYQMSRGRTAGASSRTYRMCVNASPPWEGEDQTSRHPHTPWMKRGRESSTHVSKSTPVIGLKKPNTSDASSLIGWICRG